MALIINEVALETGILVNGSYARIDTVSGSKESIQVSLNFYVDQNSYATDKSYLKQEIHTFIPSVDDYSPNFIKQGYEHLKTLPEFSNAIDA